MQRIPVPRVSYSDIEVTLSGVRYLFTYRYNSRNGRWKLDIRDSDNNYSVKGLSLIEGTTPILHLKSIGFEEGSLIINQLNAAEDKATRDNVGITKPYELVYVTFSEIEGDT